MRAPVLLSIGLTLLLLAGCAAAMPGYVPDNGRHKLLDKAKAQASPPSAHTGGAYIPTDKERSFNCRRLTGIIQIKIQQLRGDESRAPASPITSVSEKAMSQPMAGGRVKSADASEHARDRARLVAFNELMIEKQCGHFRLDEELDPAKSGTPEPVRPAGKPPKKRN